MQNVDYKSIGEYPYYSIVEKAPELVSSSNSANSCDLEQVHVPFWSLILLICKMGINATFENAEYINVLLC